MDYNTAGGEALSAKSITGASVDTAASIHEGMMALGVYTFECFDKDGNLKWTDKIENLVVNVGKNLMLDSALAGSAYTVTGPFLGLLNGTVTFSATDTMASKTWTEVGLSNAPAYTGNRPTAAWSAASGGSKALSSALSYAITSGGTIAGAFLVYGSAATNVKDLTVGTLFSEGTFTGGSRTVSNGDTVNVSYSVGL